MGYRQIVMWVIALAAFCVSGEVQAVKVTYTGTSVITTDTSNAAIYPLSASDLGFADGTNLQGLTVDFSVMFDSASFGPDTIPSDMQEALYPYIGASSYTFQVAGGNLVSTELSSIRIEDDIGGTDHWRATSGPNANGTSALIFLDGPLTVFDDDSLRALIDPDDFTVVRSFSLLWKQGEVVGALETEISELNATVVPTPAAAGAGLMLLGGLMLQRGAPRHETRTHRLGS